MVRGPRDNGNATPTAQISPEIHIGTERVLASPIPMPSSASENSGRTPIRRDVPDPNRELTHLNPEHTHLNRAHTRLNRGHAGARRVPGWGGRVPGWGGRVPGSVGRVGS
ncbi:hypothetical protein Atai01_36210 [Amycolatopsis taiwanensis]|uniref:Uncharacterized protein n=1 Tax=Amycolatopsis taiwanensis TaxID=342230 RepID=A0A9W6R3P4_9PSEU|nr:hypothetical protein Atai01_36210 [Amycolatopsis taiwanensis]